MAAELFRWSQMEEGVFRRPADIMEEFYTWVGSPRSQENKQNWHMNFGMKLEIDDQTLMDNALASWLEVRRRWPSLAAVLEDGIWTYHSANDPAEQARWLEETFHVHRTSLTARKLWSTPTFQPSRRLALHVLPNTQEIMLCGPHVQGDALAYLKIMSTIVSSLADPARAWNWSDEAARLQAPLAVTCQTPQYSPEQKSRWDGLADAWAASLPALSLRTTNSTQPAGCSATQWLVFGVEDTGLIRAALRQHDLPLFAAAQAAVSLAARSHCAEGADPNTHATFGLYSARDFVRSGRDVSDITVPHVLGLPLVFPLSDSFVDTARRAASVFADAKGKDNFLLAVSPLWTSDLPRMLAHARPEGAPPPADLQLSFLGSLDSQLLTEVESVDGDVIRCLDWWGALDMVSANVVCPTFIFGGKLVFNVGYNTTFHTQESIHALLSSIGDQFRSGLALTVNPICFMPGEEEWLRGAA